MQALTWLNLSLFSVGEDELRTVGRIASIEHLQVSGPDVTGDGLRHLTGLPAPRNL